MAIRFKLDGLEIEADSASEAMELYRQLAKRNGKLAGGTSEATRTKDVGPTDGSAALLGGKARAMMKFLMTKPDGETTGTIAAAAGVNGPKGLASLTRQIREWSAGQFGLDSDCVQREYRVGLDGNEGSFVKLSAALLQRIKGREKEFLG